MVEHSAVNRRVVSSNLTRGAKSLDFFRGFLVLNNRRSIMEHYLYILKSKSADKFYVGISQNPKRRLEYHNTFEKGFTSRYRPWEIVFTQEFNSKKEASIIEIKIKKWKSKKMIERVIRGEVKL